MADRTHEAEEELTGIKAPTRQGQGAGTTPPTPGPYQEGRVDSIGERPTGQDRDDRAGEGQGRGVGRREEGRGPDEFVSSKVNDRTARPLHDSKTRS